jgi:hypothetical protein
MPKTRNNVKTDIDNKWNLKTQNYFFVLMLVTYLRHIRPIVLHAYIIVQKLGECLCIRYLDLPNNILT